MAQKYNNFVEVDSNFCQKLNTPSKVGQRCSICCQSGKILPNLVTLITAPLQWLNHGLGYCYFKMILIGPLRTTIFSNEHNFANLNIRIQDSNYFFHNSFAVGAIFQCKK